jgi:hypothetical protein
MVISTHLPPPVVIESTADRALVTHILCWQLCHMLFRRRLFSALAGRCGLPIATVAGYRTVMSPNSKLFTAVVRRLNRRKKRSSFRELSESFTLQVGSPICPNLFKFQLKAEGTSKVSISNAMSGARPHGANSRFATLTSPESLGHPLGNNNRRSKSDLFIRTTIGAIVEVLARTDRHRVIVGHADEFFAMP